jgi:hypothetical protein
MNEIFVTNSEKSALSKAALQALVMSNDPSISFTKPTNKRSECWANYTYNGTVCTVERDGRPSGVQIITFTEKLTNLKYELLMAHFDRDIRILRN